MSWSSREPIATLAPSWSARPTALGPERLYARLASMDPAAAARIEPGNARRIVRALEVPALTGRPFSSFADAWERYDPDAVRAAGLRMSREPLVERIRARVRAMLDDGWIDEVRSLVDAGFGGWLTSTQAIGYAELARHLRGEMTLEEAVAGDRQANDEPREAADGVVPP